MRDLKENNELLSLVKIIVNLVERLKVVKEDLKVGELINAAESLRDLKKDLLIHDDDRKEVGDKREPVVFELLRKEWFDCFDELQEVSVRVLSSAIRFDSGNGKLRVVFKFGIEKMKNVELRMVLTAMEIAGVLDYGLAKVADLMVKYIIIPTVNAECNFHLVEELLPNCGQMDEAILSLVVSSSDSKVETANIYSRLIQVINFIHKTVCFQNGRWMTCFGRLTWPRISDLVISEVLSKAVPDDASKIVEFQKLIELITEFEASLKDLMFISATDKKDEKLSSFVQNVEVHFAARKKKEILTNARNLLLLFDSSNPSDYTIKLPSSKARQVAGIVSEKPVSLLFLPERCIISKAASKLMELVHQALQDVCLSSARVAMEFYHAARDALFLYQAIMPVKLEKQLNNVTQIAALVHNDCLFLAQEVLGLAFEYRPDFPSCIKEQAVFVDITPRFHQMADELLQKQIQLVCINLEKAIDGADGFQNTHQLQQYEFAKSSIDQVVFILEKVRSMWEPLFLQSTYHSSMFSVLDFVFSIITKDILLLDDMAAEETLQLQRLIYLTLENLASVFQSVISVNEKEDSQDVATLDLIDVLIPSLCKLRKLADLLDMSLKTIAASWECGELVSCGFTPSEVENFIRAIFTDSPLRKECLWKIESVSLYHKI
ncbi:centromere/kinetochore protein zw10 homolog [Papaver somniferum]|uniref:centromere/kinetochore protein zw10 homolog n=1 Tax=Papaver somniferum TaxID=3469 RepID=UPI000E6FD138|nr:centromere/kinetochore protein zw10 homolog [Papaver somniferum]